MEEKGFKLNIFRKPWRHVFSGWGQINLSLHSTVLKIYSAWHAITNEGLSARVLNLRLIDHWFQPHQRNCCVLEQDILSSLLSTGSTQENSQTWLKIFDLNHQTTNYQQTYLTLYYWKAFFIYRWIRIYSFSFSLMTWRQTEQYHNTSLASIMSRIFSRHSNLLFSRENYLFIIHLLVDFISSCIYSDFMNSFFVFVPFDFKL